MNPKAETFETLLGSIVGLSTEVPIIGFFLLAAVSMMPFIVLAFTSFIKLSVVFGILRSALGTGNIPSTSVIALLSFILSIHVMAPNFSGLDLDEIAASSSQPVSKDVLEETKKISLLMKSVSQPLSQFLKSHSRVKEREFFLAYSGVEVKADCSEGGKDCAYEGETLFSLIPAFVLSELREAFAIGFVVFLPFLIIDLVVANLLVGMGMMMVSPAAISLPFKILLFVSCDGWFLLSRSLILGYGG